jgi:hypothetical protein
MRVRHSLAQANHRFFDELGFFWVHTPIITASDAEGTRCCSASRPWIWPTCRVPRRAGRFRARFLWSRGVSDGLGQLKCRGLLSRAHQDPSSSEQTSQRSRPLPSRYATITGCAIRPATTTGANGSLSLTDARWAPTRRSASARSASATIRTEAMPWRRRTRSLESRTAVCAPYRPPLGGVGSTSHLSARAPRGALGARAAVQAAERRRGAARPSARRHASAGPVRRRHRRQKLSPLINRINDR